MSELLTFSDTMARGVHAVVIKSEFPRSKAASATQSVSGTKRIARSQRPNVQAGQEIGSARDVGGDGEQDGEAEETRDADSHSRNVTSASLRHEEQAAGDDAEDRVTNASQYTKRTTRKPHRGTQDEAKARQTASSEKLQLSVPNGSAVATVIEMHQASSPSDVGTQSAEPEQEPSGVNSTTDVLGLLREMAAVVCPPEVDFDDSIATEFVEFVSLPSRTFGYGIDVVDNELDIWLADRSSGQIWQGDYHFQLLSSLSRYDGDALTIALADLCALLGDPIFWRWMHSSSQTQQFLARRWTPMLGCK